MVWLSLGLAFIYPFLFSDQNDTQILGSENGRDLQKEWHADNVWLWGVTFVAVAAMAYGVSWVGVAYVAAARAWHWIAFDASLNYRRNLPWDYVSGAANAANSDKLLLQVKAYQVPIKVGLLALCLVLYILSLNLLHAHLCVD